MFFGYRKSLVSLTDEQFGRVIRAALAYAEDGDVQELDPLETLAFAVVRGDIDRARAAYDEKCEHNRNSVKKRWEKAKAEEGPSIAERLSMDTNVYERMNAIPDHTNVYERYQTKQDKTNQNNTNQSESTAASAAPARAKKSVKKFVPPTVDEVAAYCAENGYGTINPEAFVDYYEANGWKVGTQAMKDWRATVRNWARRDKERGGGYARREESGDPFLRVLNEEFAKEMAKNEQSGNSGRAENPSDGLSGLLFPAAR